MQQPPLEDPRRPHAGGLNQPLRPDSGPLASWPGSLLLGVEGESRPHAKFGRALCLSPVALSAPAQVVNKSKAPMDPIISLPFIMRLGRISCLV
jgi:hypothetical protein